MNKLLLVITVAIAFTSCGNDSTEDLGNQSIIQGNFFIESLNNSNNTANTTAVKLEGNRFSSLAIQYPNLVNRTSAIYQVNTGVFTINGDTMTVTYDRETCNVKGQESFTIRQIDDGKKITMSKGQQTIFLANEKYYAPALVTPSLSVLTEDTGCTF